MSKGWETGTKDAEGGEFGTSFRDLERKLEDPG